MKSGPTKQSRILFNLSLFCTAAAVLSYEFYLIRILSLVLWYSFAHLIISMAMLGFGVSGSCLWLLQNRIKRMGPMFFFYAAAAFVFITPLCLWLALKIEMDPLMILWSPAEYFNLLLVSVVGHEIRAQDGGSDKERN